MSPFAPFRISLDACIRPAREADLPTLEWFGLFSDQRGLLQSLFAQQQHGKALILVVEVNEVASGQLWIDFHPQTRTPERSVGYFWAIRIFPALQNRGIGTRLIAAAESVLVEREIRFAELSVEQSNARATALYRRLGYRQIKGLRHATEQIFLEKDLMPERAGRRRAAHHGARS